MEQMQPSNAALVLASASPRRLELLSFFGIPFEVIPSAAEESAEGNGQEMVMAIAKAKCDDVFAGAKGSFVLSADTLVCVDGAALGKPKDEAEAISMLKRLSGCWHEVHTGVCLRGKDGFFSLQAETTRVAFAKLTDEMICRYVKTGEPMDKAGAYAIQGISGMFITRIDGSPSNVMGLPLEKVRTMLEKAGFSILPALKDF